MRGFLSCIVASTIFSSAVVAADTGVPPRAASADYPVHDRADAATIAAAIIPANQVSKMFSPEIAIQYIVVEVAIYPDGGGPFDVQSSSFALRVGPRVGLADRPIDVAPWPERRNPSGRSPVDVTTEAGVIYQRSNDPVYGRQQGVGTDTRVDVEAPGRRDPPPPPPDPKVDPRAVYDKVQRFALAEGATQAAIAGYLYFPQFTKRKKSDEIELKYVKDNVAVHLLLVKP
jgi:hypothetical protein